MNFDEIFGTKVEQDALDGVHRVKIDSMTAIKEDLETKQSAHFLLKGHYVDIDKTFINYIWLPRDNDEQQLSMFNLTIKNLYRQLGFDSSCTVKDVFDTINNSHPEVDITLKTVVKDGKTYTNTYYYKQQSVENLADELLNALKSGE